MNVCIIDCGAGNLHSVAKALRRELPADGTLDIVTEASALDGATHIVLPGVGAFADCMAGLAALPGMRAALEKKVMNGTTPFLGICVGMQMLFERGYEHGTHDGLGWFKGEVAKLMPNDDALRIPHMGWNALHLKRAHPFFENVQDGESAYFVHSYAAQHVALDNVLASADYGGEVIASVGRDHIVATQFHPEKSQRLGLTLLGNFLRMRAH